MHQKNSDQIMFVQYIGNTANHEHPTGYYENSNDDHWNIWDDPNILKYLFLLIITTQVLL